MRVNGLTAFLLSTMILAIVLPSIRPALAFTGEDFTIFSTQTSPPPTTQPGSTDAVRILIINNNASVESSVTLTSNSTTTTNCSLSPTAVGPIPARSIAYSTLSCSATAAGRFVLDVTATDSVSLRNHSVLVDFVFGDLVNLDANSVNAADPVVTPSANEGKTFSIGAVLNASSTAPLTGVFGWQFEIDYNSSSFTPQADPSTASTYPDGAGNTVNFGSQTAANWAAMISAKKAFQVVTFQPASVLVAFTILAPNPPLTISSENLLANVAFELNNKPADPQSFTITNVFFTDSNGNILPVSSGTSATETITNTPPTARFNATPLSKGDTSCTPITGSPCSAFAFKFNAAFSSDVEDGTISKSGFFWDFGDGSQDSVNVALSGCAAGILNCSQGAVATHDYLVSGQFEVTLRVVDGQGATGSARDSFGNAILNEQPSHTSLSVPVRSTSTTVNCASPTTIGEESTCTVTVSDTASGTAVTPTGTVDLSETGVTGAFTACTLGGTGPSAMCLSTFYASTAGTATVTAGYLGDSQHSGSSSTAEMTVNVRTTSTTVTCTSPVNFGQTSKCIVNVTDNSLGTFVTPTGNFALTTNATGTFGGNCPLSGTSASATCSVTYTPIGTTPHHDQITASYPGDLSHSTSTGSYTLRIANITLARTSTTVNCSPTSLPAGSTTSCSATVTDTSSTPTTPTGNVGFTTNSTGSFMPSTSCSLLATSTTAASCSVSYTPSVEGGHVIAGGYNGDSGHAMSVGKLTLAVAARTVDRTSTTVSCSTAPVPAGFPARCAVTVKDTSASPTIPTGTVKFTTNSTGTFGRPATSCTLTSTSTTGTAICSVSYTPTMTGLHSITGSYGSDPSHSGSTGNFALSVRPSQPGKTTLTFTGLDTDDFENSVSQLQVVINGHLALDIPAGLNTLTGTGDYTSYTGTAISFGPFDITSYLVSGPNNITFTDPLHYYFDSLHDITIVQNSTLLGVSWSGVSPGHPHSYIFTNPSQTFTLLTLSPVPTPASHQTYVSATLSPSTSGRRLPPCRSPAEPVSGLGEKCLGVLSYLSRSLTGRWWARPDSNRGPSGVSDLVMSLPLSQSPLRETWLSYGPFRAGSR